jgi:succinoglycan biosynthesis transport protein ExoP
MSIEIGNLDVKSIIRRRKKIFLATFALIFCACLAVAFYLPSIYKSEVMISIENQEIPEEYVKSTVTSYISERLEVLERKILSYPQLLKIIKAHALYPELSSNGEMVRQMQEDITLKTINVSLQDRRSGGRGTATIAFTLAYQHKIPEKAKQVTDILSNLYVQEDQKAREKQAGTTTIFLEKELEDLRAQVKMNEEKISRFKAANIDRLPGSTGIFQQTVFRLEQDMDNIETRIRTLQEKIVYLKSQIANIDPLVPILTDSGKVASNPNNRLKYLRLQLIQKQSNLSDKHPDIIRLKGEIQELEAQVGTKDTSMEQMNRLKIVEEQIAELKSKYGNKHPDLVKLTREADLLTRQIARNGNAGNSQAAREEQSDNPGYMNIRAQIIVAQSEIDALRDERVKTGLKLEDYQKRLEMAPFIDEEYNSLTLDYENAKKKFNEVSNKLHSARISQEMDISEQGQRFRIEHPAILPEKPSEPNRLLIILMGFVLGAGCAVLVAALAEGLDSSIKASDEMESVLGFPVLATISLYDTPQQKRSRRLKRVVVASSIIAIVLLVSLVVDRYVVPLNDIWTKFEDRLVEMGVPIEKTSEKLS